MSQPAILLPLPVFASLSPSARDEILSVIGLSGSVGSPAIPRSTTVTSGEPLSDGPADLTVAMARKLIAQPINEKTIAALRTIAQSPTPEFRLADAVRAAPGAETYMDLRGAWSGITRRSRKILADETADLIWWEGEWQQDDNENSVDHVGRVSQLTHQSLRTVFGIRN